MYGAFSIGLALTIGILFVSKLSLGALNPAVAVALWAKGAIKATTAIVYIIAEIIGGLLAVLWWNYAGGSALPPLPPHALIFNLLILSIKIIYKIILSNNL